MKRPASIILLFILGLCACSPAVSATPEVVLASTATPAPEATPSPSPTISLPVSLGTPLPDPGAVISGETLPALREFARYYGDLPYVARLTRDGSRLIVRDQLGVDLYDFTTDELLLHVDFYTLRVDGLTLQISDDGEWSLIDRQWLLHLPAGTGEPELTDLRARPDLDPGFKGKNFVLSPDAKLAISEYACSDRCIDRLTLVDLATGQSDYVSMVDTDVSLHGLYPVFSPDGMRIATEANNKIAVWNVSDKLLVNEFPLDRFSYGYSFSSNGSLLAIRQMTNRVDIWNVETGVKIQGIEPGTACDGIETLNSAPLFGPASTVAIFDCAGSVQVWSAAGGNLLTTRRFDRDVPSIVFTGAEEITQIGPRRDTGPWEAYYDLNTFLFQDDETLVFRDNKRECSLPLNARPEECREEYVRGTNGAYFRYHADANILKLYTGGPAAATAPLYEMRWPGQDIQVNAFDPGRDLLFYTAWLNTYTPQGMLVDLKTGNTVAKWDQRMIESHVFSANGKKAALCLRLFSYGTGFSDKGKLVLVDLEQEKVTYEVQFPCSSTPLALTDSGGRLAFSRMFWVTEANEFQSELLLLDVENPYERGTIEVECAHLQGSTLATIGALAFSHDDALLVVGCKDGSLRFFDAASQVELHRLDGYPGVEGLVFSPDDKKLAVSHGGGIISVLAVPPGGN